MHILVSCLFLFPSSYSSLPCTAHYNIQPAGQTTSSLDANTGSGQLDQGLQGISAYDPGIIDPDCVSKTLLYIYHQPTAPAPIALPYTPPMILRLPILRPKQQQRVESLRMQDEPRGFKPIPPQVSVCTIGKYG